MKKKPASSSRRWSWFHEHRLGCYITLLVVGLLIFGNCFAHLPTETRAKFGPFEVICESLGATTAGVTDTLGITGHDASVEYAKEPPIEPLPFGVPEVADASKVPGEVQILKRKGYWVGYSPALRRPVWAAYVIPVQRLLESIPDRPSRFFRDKEVKSSPVHEDYTSSGYDRGHLAPNYAIATYYGEAAQKETFLMTNIAPQEPELNRGPWRILEAFVADDLPARIGTVWVIVCLVPGSETLTTSRRGDTHINIPEGFGMILASVKENRLYAIAVYMPQDTKETKRPRYCFRSIRWIEERTGLNFFSGLSQDRQDMLETIEVSRFWPKWKLIK